MKDKDEVNEGWITLHRKIMKHWIWKDRDYFQAWLTILLMVNHNKQNVTIEGEVLECKRGEALRSLNGWTKLFGRGWTIQRTRTFFGVLRKEGMINTLGLRKSTRLTVCNYDTYQNMQQAEAKKSTSSQQQTTMNNKFNKKNGEAEPKRKVIHHDTI